MREAHPEGCQARAERWQPLAICPRPAASLLWRQGAGTRAAAERQAASSPAAAAASHSRQHARADGPQWQSSQISMIEMMSGCAGKLLPAPTPALATSCLGDENCLYLFCRFDVPRWPPRVILCDAKDEMHLQGAWGLPVWWHGMAVVLSHHGRCWVLML